MTNPNTILDIDLSVRDYVEDLVKAAEKTQITIMAGGSQIQQSGLKAEVQGLIPFINIFETAFIEQKKMLETLQTRMELLQTSMKEDSGDLNQKIESMAGAFSQLFSTFQGLNESYESSQNIASRSGKMIESLHKMKRRSLKAKELLSIFLDLVNGKGTNRLDSLLGSTSQETRKRGAKCMRRLKIIAESSIPGTEIASKQILDMSKRYEERLLNEFHQAFEENNMEQMKDAASLLVTFNGGKSSVESFVSQHAFFIDPFDVSTLITKYHPSKEMIALDLSKPAEPDPSLTSLIEQIAQTAEADWMYLEAVFDDPIMVMNHLIERIFREPLKQHLDEVLRQAKHHSLIAYLRSLFASYQAIGDLLKRMKISYGKHIRESGAINNRSVVEIESLINSTEELLDGLSKEVFSDHLNPQIYNETERKVFADLMLTAISPLESYLQSIRSKSGGVMTSVFSRGISMTGSPRPQSPVDVDPMTRANFYIFDKGEPLVKPNEGSDGVPIERVILNCLSIHSESTRRMYSLASTELRGSILEESIRSLFYFIFERYLECALDIALDTNIDPGKGLNEHSFKIIKSTCKILSMVLYYCDSQFLPVIVSSSSLAYRNMVQVKTESASRITERIERLLKKELLNSLNFVSDYLLSKQKKTDYRPKPDDLEALVGCSQACEAVYEFVTKLSKMVNQYMDGKNSAHFLTEFGTGLYSLLLNHIKSYSISDSGAMVLQNDLKKYRSLVDIMKPASDIIVDLFEMLWQLGHLFVVRPDNLRAILKEGQLARLDLKLIYPFISQRADFDTSNIQQLFPEMEKSYTRLFKVT